MTPDEMDEVVTEFLVESHENIDALDRALLALERNPGDVATLGAVFRSIHTVKGASGFLGFDRLTGLTHAAENLLCVLRDGARVLDPESSAALFATVDAVRAMLRSIEAEGHDGGGDHRALQSELERIYRGEEKEVAPGQAEVAEPAADPASPAANSASLAADSASLAADSVSPAADPEADLAADPEADPKADPEAGPAADPEADPAQEPAPVPATGATTIRVSVGLLDRLMNLVGELVLARNQILQCDGVLKDPAFAATSQRLDLVTTELQEGVMKTRMQPIGTVWGRFPRVVRDLSRLCGKDVRLEVEGADTELDRTLLEAITDPLTHLVRNAIDHGIESPAERLAAGKPAQGRLFLRAYHEGSKVNIEISDDGSGIDLTEVREKARGAGLLRGGAGRRMTDQEMLNLIFTPGLSTASAVTGISGRGVGLDVVKTNIERIGGSAEVSSEKGVGTSFRLKIPLSLAIIPALVVSAGGQRFAIPQGNLLELVRLRARRGPEGIEYVHGAPVHRLRGTLLPVVDLACELQLGEGAVEREGEQTVNLVVVQALDQRFGLAVDEICDTEEIVVRPLSRLLRQLEVFAGATIMGDGRVSLILDLAGLGRRAGVITEGGRTVDPVAAPEDDVATTQRLLLVSAGDNRRMAIPLSDVHRLEEIPAWAVEVAGGREVAQYRGGILPLIRLDGSAQGATEPLEVVVHERAGKPVGLVFDSIIDIVEEHVALDAGSLPTAVIRGRVTELIDVESVVDAAAGGLAGVS